MRKSTFGKTGYPVSCLGFGGAPIGLLKTDRDRVGEILRTLLDAGVNLIDTAAGYAGSEELIAAAVGHRRGEFVIVSKCGGLVPGVTGADWSAGLIAQTVDRSLANLKTDHLDVMLLHSCDLQTLKTGEALGALVRARDAGKIRFAGYSGDNEAAAYAAALPDIAVLETSISIADQVNIDNALPVARKHNVGVLAKRPIANAAWKPKSAQPGFYGDYAQPYHDRLAKMNLDPAALGIAGNPDEAWPQLALRFTLSMPGVHTAIIGTTNPDNARANIDAANKGPLPEAAVGKIRAAFHSHNPGNWNALG
jgi:aryl-alcohol dehydrogenase-like predicted oxidoreductase